MGPRRRPTIPPAQTQISVQDVADYSTPEGAAMANEEMRRIKLQIDALAAGQSEAAGSGQDSQPQQPPQQGDGGGGGQGPDQYGWSVSADTGGAASVPSGSEVAIVGANGIRTARSGTTIIVYGKEEIWWQAVTDDGQFNVYDEQRAKFTGVNGVSTYAMASDYAVVIDRPLSIRKRGLDVALPDTVAIDFWNQANLKPASHTESVWFDVVDLGDGARRVSAYVPAGGGGSYSWDFETQTGVPETVGNGELIEIVGSGSVTVTNVGNVITIQAPMPSRWFLAAAGTPGTEQVDDGETVTFIAAGDLSVLRSGATVQYSYTNPNPTPYFYNIQANGGATEQIDTGETVNFVGTGAAVVSRSGNTITVDVAPSGSYTWDLKANGGATVTVNSGDDVDFIGSGDIVVSRSGTAITIAYTNPNPTPYHFFIQANAGATEQISATEVVTIQQGGDISVSRVGNVITVAYTNPNPTPYTLLVQDDGVSVGAADVDTLNYDSNGATGTNYVEWEVADMGGGVRRIRGKYTPGGGGSYDWTASDGTLSSLVTSSETVVWTGASGVVVSLNTGTQTFTIDRPLTIRKDGVDVGGDDTTVVNFDNDTALKPAPYTSRVWFDVNDDGGGVRTVVGWFDPGAGSYTWTASDGPTNLTVASADEVTWTGTNGLTVLLDVPTKTFTLNRPLQLQQDGTPVGAADTTTINFDNDTGLKPVGHTGRVWSEIFDDGSGVRRVVQWFDPGAGSYGWNIEANDGTGSTGVASGATVKISGIAGIRVTRSGDDITIQPDPNDPPWGGAVQKRTKTGELVFTPTDPDYIGPTPAYMYGTRLYKDIVHGWNLQNMNNFHLELVDKALDDLGALTYYRSGVGSSAGEDLGNQPFRNFPHWHALDRNTIRVYATMSRLKPTDMIFRYTLVEL